MWPRVARALVVLVVLMVAPLARGHDIGVMAVSVELRPDRVFRIEVAFDPEHLPPGLAGVGAGHGIDGNRGALARALQSEVLLAAVARFDGRPRALQPGPIESADTPGDSGGSRRIRVELTGDAPDGADEFTWACDLAVGQYLLRVTTPGAEEPGAQWLNGGEESRTFAVKPAEVSKAGGAADRGGVVLTYLKLGYTHIIPEGLDHILFVLGLFLLSMKVRPILAQVTAFTVAHSITLGLSMYGVVRLPPSVVEPAIALSIAYVAVENLMVTKFKPSRTAVVFGFGLIHGLGFAGVLKELGLPRGEFLPALVSFNVGVELGQLSVIGAAFVAVGLWCGSKPWYRARVVIPASACIALVGMYWAVERVAA